MASGEPGARAPARHARRAALLAAGLYFGLALWAVRAILPAPASTFAYPRSIAIELPRWQGIVQSDQRLTAALIVQNARALLHTPSRLMDGGQCYPAPHAVTLGEHMFGVGLLGVVPYALTGDPIVTYNTVVALTFVIAAVAMYALVYFWTESTAAALIAGLLFGFHPTRIANLVHPYVYANQWTPLALLFAARLFARGRWRDAAGLSLFLGLQMLESLYAVLAMTVIGGTYAIHLLVRHRRSLPALAPKLLAVVAVTGCVAAAVLGPYLQTRGTWNTLTGRASFLNDVADFGLGHSAYPGSVLLLLALVGIGDRVRGARNVPGAYDPRLAYLAAGLLVVWASSFDFTVPGLGARVPSLFLLASRVLPGLDALRGAASLCSGVYLVGAFLAGYGVLALTERRGLLVRSTVATVAAAAVLVEVFHPLAARASFGTTLELQSYRVQPVPLDLDLYAKMVEGPVLDLPLDFTAGHFFRMGDYVFAGAFHGRRVAACYNSFILPIQNELQGLSDRMLREADAGHALYGLGFRNVLVHLIEPGRRKPGPMMPVPLPPYLVERGRSGTTVLLELTSALSVQADLAALVPTDPPAVVDAPSSAATLPVRFRNGSAAIYRHPDPIVPTRLVAQWRDGTGVVIGEHRVTALLPLALAPGAETVREISLPVPAASGTYELTLAPEGAPTQVIARLAVRVRTPEPPGAAP